MTDIPLSKDIDPKVPIEIQTETGIFRLFPLHVTRGSGKRKGNLTIRGVCHSPAELLTRCHALFKGHKIEGSFSRVEAADYVWHVTYDMVVAIPEFWGET